MHEGSSNLIRFKILQHLLSSLEKPSSAKSDVFLNIVWLKSELFERRHVLISPGARDSEAFRLPINARGKLKTHQIRNSLTSSSSLVSAGFAISLTHKQRIIIIKQSKMNKYSEIKHMHLVRGVYFKNRYWNLVGNIRGFNSPRTDYK